MLDTACKGNQDIWDMGNVLYLEHLGVTWMYPIYTISLMDVQKLYTFMHAALQKGVEKTPIFNPIFPLFFSSHNTHTHTPHIHHTHHTHVHTTQVI